MVLLLTAILVRVTRKTIETRTENQKETEQHSLMSKSIFFKQIFKLIAIPMDKTWNASQIFLALVSVWSRYVLHSSSNGHIGDRRSKQKCFVSCKSTLTLMVLTMIRRSSKYLQKLIQKIFFHPVSPYDF